MQPSEWALQMLYRRSPAGKCQHAIACWSGARDVLLTAAISDRLGCCFDICVKLLVCARSIADVDWISDGGATLVGAAAALAPPAPQCLWRRLLPPRLGLGHLIQQAAWQRLPLRIAARHSHHSRIATDTLGVPQTALSA